MTPLRGGDARRAREVLAVAVLPALVALALTAACAPARPAVTPRSRTRAQDAAARRSLACGATDLPAPHFPSLPDQHVPVGATVTSVDIRGNGAVPAKLVRAALRVKPGQPLDPDAVAADLRRLWRLEAFSDVRAEVEPEDGGVALVYVLEQRSLVGRVFSDGDRDVRFGVHPGDLYEPSRLERRARALVSTARDAGHLQARAEVHGRRVDAHTVDVCVSVHRGPRFVIDRIVFDGNHKVDDATLRDALHTGGGKVNTAGKPYRADLLEQDSVWLSAVYWDRGMLSAHIGVPHVTLHPARHTVTVHIKVSEGPVFRIGRLSFHGRLLSSRRTYRKLLGMKRGEVFDRSRLLHGLERIRDYHLWRGRRSLDVEPDPHLDRERHIVNLVVKVEKAK